MKAKPQAVATRQLGWFDIAAHLSLPEGMAFEHVWKATKAADYRKAIDDLERLTPLLLSTAGSKTARVLFDLLIFPQSDDWNKKRCILGAIVDGAVDAAKEALADAEFGK